MCLDGGENQRGDGKSPAFSVTAQTWIQYTRNTSTIHIDKNVHPKKEEL